MVLQERLDLCSLHSVREEQHSYTVKNVLKAFRALFSFDLETKICEQNAKRVSGGLIGFANNQRRRVPFCWRLEQVRWTPCFGFGFDLSANKILYTRTKLSL